MIAAPEGRGGHPLPAEHLHAGATQDAGTGLHGHSGGGFASTDAILRYPDFFKVAVSGAGNHDNRTYGFFWGEKYQGLLTRDAREKERRKYGLKKARKAPQYSKR